MPIATKTSQLQVRVSPAQKRAIQQAAKRAGLDMSSYVLAKLLPAHSVRFQSLLRELARADEPRFALAGLNDLLSGLTPDEFTVATDGPPRVELSPFLASYVAAMVEQAAVRSRAPVPQWVRSIAGLEIPVFGSDLLSVRLHLLTHSPPAFRRRNIFIDATIGDRV